MGIQDWWRRRVEELDDRYLRASLEDVARRNAERDGREYDPAEVERAMELHRNLERRR